MRRTLVLRDFFIYFYEVKYNLASQQDYCSAPRARRIYSPTRGLKERSEIHEPEVTLVNDSSGSENFLF
jgi:hypothetical protein